MGEKIGSVIWDIVILAGFVYLLLVMKGKVTPPQPIPFIQKPNIGVKVLIYAGVILFALVVILELTGK